MARHAGAPSRMRRELPSWSRGATEHGRRPQPEAQAKEPKRTTAAMDLQAKLELKNREHWEAKSKGKGG